jgi:hypothetical protein
MDGEQLINTSLKTQDDTMAALKRIEATTVDSKQIGMDTAEELIRQTEQMDKIGQNLDKIDDELTISNKVCFFLAFFKCYAVI